MLSGRGGTKGTSMKGHSVVQERTGPRRRWVTDLVRLGIVDPDLMEWD
jgi:hypothetical protein